MSEHYRVISAALVALSCALPVTAYADQPGTSTISTSQEPIIMDGKLRGCTINFEVGRDDPQFSQGKTVLASGSLTFMTYDDKAPAFALKLGVRKIGAREFQPPAEAYLLDGATTNLGDYGGQLESRNPGYRVFAFAPGRSTFAAAIDAPVHSETLTIAYSMKSGEIAAIMPVDLRIRQISPDPAKSLIDHQTILGWGDCIEPLLRKWPRK